MTLVAKANAIKAALSLPPDMAPVAAIGAACEMMGFVPERGSTLPAIADALITQIGCTVESVTAPTAPTPPDTAAAAALAEATAASKKAAGKRKASSSSTSDFVEPPKASKQPKVFEAKGIAKFFVPKKALEQLSQRQSDGEAVAYDEMQAAAGLEVRELPSEKEPTRSTRGCCWRRSHRGCCGVWALGSGSFLSPWWGSRRSGFLNARVS